MPDDSPDVSEFKFFKILEDTIVGLGDYALRFLRTSRDVVIFPSRFTKSLTSETPGRYSRPFTYVVVSSYIALLSFRFLAALATLIVKNRAFKNSTPGDEYPLLNSDVIVHVVASVSGSVSLVSLIAVSLGALLPVGITIHLLRRILQDEQQDAAITKTTAYWSGGFLVVLAAFASLSLVLILLQMSIPALRPVYRVDVVSDVLFVCVMLLAARSFHSVCFNSLLQGSSTPRIFATSAVCFIHALTMFSASQFVAGYSDRDVLRVIEEYIATEFEPS